MINLTNEQMMDYMDNFTLTLAQRSLLMEILKHKDEEIAALKKQLDLATRELLSKEHYEKTGNLCETVVEVKTYAESQNEQPFDWWKALEEPDKDWPDLRTKAASWTTCACGNVCDIIPRDEVDAPKDSQLAYLGSYFYVLIANADVVTAKEVLKEIEERSGKLIGELLTKQQ
jgi:hypothetical protein